MSNELIPQEHEHKPAERAVDRSGWPAGPWDGEPDYMQWEYLGHPCIAVRNPLGNWCGYAGVHPGHLAYGRHYEEVDVQAHGGLTYSGGCRGAICHTPKPGEPPTRWLGFDCAHAGDLVPGMLRLHERFNFRGPSDDDLFSGDVYRTLGYVRHEVEELVDQLQALTPDRISDSSAERARSAFWFNYTLEQHKAGREFGEIQGDYDRVMAEHEASLTPKLLEAPND